MVEDDSQAGTDHVDGHRAPIQIISPWANHGTVDSHYYSQITMIRTIEQILGIHPMNQKDSAATPMAAAFTKKPDYTPFTGAAEPDLADPGSVDPADLWRGHPGAAGPEGRARPTGKVPADKQEVAAKWQSWKSNQPFTGPHAKADSANPAQMNHFSWYEAHGWTKPYPGETKVYAPDQVPGAYIPPSDSDG